MCIRDSNQSEVPISGNISVTFSKEMDTTEAEGFAVDQLQEQGLKDVPKFFAGSVSGDD